MARGSCRVHCENYHELQIAAQLNHPGIDCSIDAFSIRLEATVDESGAALTHTVRCVDVHVSHYRVVKHRALLAIEGLE